MGGVVPQSLRGAELTPEQLARIRELETQIAAEAAGSVLNKFQANFNAAIDTASDSLRQRMEAQAASAEPNKAQKEQLEVLRQIKRNGEVGVVEFL